MASRPLDEEALDDLAARSASWPEPAASLAVSVEVARADGDATGVRKRLFELGIGVVRYATSVGLALVAARLAGRSAPRPLAEALRRAARLSDGQWCDLARTVASSLRALDEPAARALAFASQLPLAALVGARNDFIHRGGPGDDALDRALALLGGAEALLAMPVSVVASLDPAAAEARTGTPVRAGVWRKTRGAVPEGAIAGEAYLALADGSAVRLTPWLPLAERRLLLVDAPHAPGKAWRWLDPETGEHREHPPLDAAIRALSGDDVDAPRELCAEPAIVGRTAARKVLARAAEEARAGGVRVVLLTGPFGIGRSRIARVMVDASAGFGFGVVVRAACSPDRRSPLRALDRALEGPGLDRVREAVKAATGPDPSSGIAARDARIEAVEEAMIEASLASPVVLSIEDVQWADEHTLALLRLFTERATRRGTGRLLVVVTARDEPKPSASLRRFVAQIEEDVGSGATRVALDPLSRGESRRLVGEVAPVADALAAALVDGAGGVPFYLVQPLLVWSETGSLAWHDGAWQPASDAVLASPPPGVRDLVRARISSYFDAGSESERAAEHVLACAALHGAGLPIERLVAATTAAGTTALAAEHALGALVVAGLLVARGQGQGHGFAQEIVRRAVLDDLRERPWLRRVHRALLDATASGPDAASEASFLATGYEALGDLREAAAWLRAAVDLAFARGSFEDALASAERLAAVSSDAVERALAGISAADAWLRSGHAALAGERLAAVVTRDLGDVRPALAARVLALEVASIVRDRPLDHDADLVADADAEGSLAHRVGARIAVARFRRGASGVALAGEAASLCPPHLGDERYRALSLRYELVVESPASDVDERRRAAADLGAAARALGSAWAELDAEGAMAVAESDAGEHARAAARFDEVATKARARRFGTLERESGLNAATSLLRAGDFAAAARRAGAVAEASRAAGDARLLAQSLSVGADAWLREGELDRARAAIDEAVAIAIAGRDYTATLALLRRAEIRARAGEIEGARADATLSCAWAERTGNLDHAVRAGLRVALLDARSQAPLAQQGLRAAAAGAALHDASLRAPTRALVAEVLSLLEDTE